MGGTQRLCRIAKRLWRSIPIIARCTVGFEEAEQGYANNREEMSRMRS